MLTQRQSELLTFIDTQQQKCGFSPSYDEMQAHMGFASKSGVARVVDALERRGFIQRFPNQARGIRVVTTLMKPLPQMTPEQYQFYEAARDYFRTEGEECATAKKRCARRAFSDMVRQEKQK